MCAGYGYTINVKDIRYQRFINYYSLLFGRAGPPVGLIYSGTSIDPDQSDLVYSSANSVHFFPFKNYKQI